MSTSPYTVKRKEFRLDKDDKDKVSVHFTIKGPTICTKQFDKEDEAQRECDMLNNVYDRGYQDGRKQSLNPNV